MGSVSSFSQDSIWQCTGCSYEQHKYHQKFNYSRIETQFGRPDGRGRDSEILNANKADAAGLVQTPIKLAFNP
jgi:hypothetical protein